MKLHLTTIFIVAIYCATEATCAGGYDGELPKRSCFVAVAFDNRAAEAAWSAVKMFTSGAERVTRAMTRHGWDATVWHSAEKHVIPPPANVRPTEANLRRYLKGLASRGAGDEIIVVLTTHLVSLAAPDGVKYFLCPEDARHDKLTKSSEVNAEHHLIALEEVYEYLNKSPAQKKLLILITAPSDRLRRPENYPPPLCSRLPKLPRPPAGVAVLTGCGEGEFSNAFHDFLDFLEEGLAGLKADGAPDGKASDGAVNVKEWVAHAQKMSKVKGEENEYKLTPTLLGKLPRDWVIAGKPSKVSWKLLTSPFDAKEAQRHQADLAHSLKLKSPVVTDGLGLQMAVIPPGEYRMGSDKGHPDERPRPTVRLTRSFFLGVHEVTQSQFEKIMGHNPSAFRRVEGQDTSSLPVEQVTFKQAVLFCNALSEGEKRKPYYKLLRPVTDFKTGKVTDFDDYAPAGGTGYRLPTEAEWEWACRAGSETDFSFGNALTGKQANIDDHRPGGVKEGAYLGRPTKVGSYAPNAWGLYDMHGNVAERVEESYDPTRYKLLSLSVSDGSGGVGYGGLARGGAWNFSPKDCRSALRLALPPNTALKFVGLRVARDLE